MLRNGTLGAMVPELNLNLRAYIIVSLRFFLNCHHVNDNMFCSKISHILPYNHLPHRRHQTVDTGTVSTVIFYCLIFVHFIEYINILHSIHNTVDIILKMVCFGRSVLQYVYHGSFTPEKLIRDKYPNRTKSHSSKNLVLIVEEVNRSSKTAA